MEIQVNGLATAVADGATLADLIAQLDLTQRRIAVELNREIVPHGQYQSRTLQSGDQVEIVHAIGGGQGDPLVIAGKAYRSRLLVGSGKYKDLEETRLATELPAPKSSPSPSAAATSARTPTSPTCST